jgi:hypothetical protein
MTGGSPILDFIFHLSKNSGTGGSFLYSEKILNNWNLRLFKKSNNRLRDTGSLSLHRIKNTQELPEQDSQECAPNYLLSQLAPCMI